MLAQLPIVLMQRSPWMKHRRLLNNILFWSSMISGLAIVCIAYVLVDQTLISWQICALYVLI